MKRKSQYLIVKFQKPKQNINYNIPVDTLHVIYTHFTNIKIKSS